jgi:hypothetical protein
MDDETLAPEYSDVVIAYGAIFPNGGYPSISLDYIDGSKEMEKAMEAD